MVWPVFPRLAIQRHRPLAEGGGGGDAFQGTGGDVAAASGIVCHPGIVAEAPPEIACSDAGKANVGVPGFRGALCEGLCHCTGRGSW